MRPALAGTALAAALGAFGCPAAAVDFNAADLYVYIPSFTAPELETGDRSLITGAGGRTRWSHALEAEWAPSRYWKTEFYDVLSQSAPRPLVEQSVEWENIFPVAKGPHLDAGFLVRGDLPSHGCGPGTGGIMPIISSKLGVETLTLNFPFEGQSGPGAFQGTRSDYAAREITWINPYAAPAFEAFGWPGPVGRWPALADQTHLGGPAIYGIVPLDRGRLLRYSASCLFGLTRAFGGRLAVFRLEYRYWHGRTPHVSESESAPIF
jgi:hypothetical protein